MTTSYEELRQLFATYGAHPQWCPFLKGHECQCGLSEARLKIFGSVNRPAPESKRACTHAETHVREVLHAGYTVEYLTICDSCDAVLPLPPISESLKGV